jgi:tartrate-resistant acid phosphatase type 5
MRWLEIVFFAGSVSVGICSHASSDTEAGIFRSGLSFVAVGDSGQLGNELMMTSKTLRELFSIEPFSFVAMLGDLAYPGGFCSPEDPHFPELFVKPYSQIDVPFFPVLGDNDYGSDEVSSSLSAYLHFDLIDPRWRMEGFYYSSIHESDGASMCSIFIDTQSLVLILYPESRTSEEEVMLSEQIVWLDSTLGSTACQNTDFIVVFGHHPLVSASRKGNKGTTSQTLRSILLPLFERFFVDAYFSGHDHDLQALEFEDRENGHTMSFIVSGSSSRIRTKIFDGPLDGINSWKSVDTIGFTVTKVSKDQMETIFVSSANGEVIHTHLTKSHRRFRVAYGSS